MNKYLALLTGRAGAAISQRRAVPLAAPVPAASLRVVLALCGTLAATAARAEPRVFWASDPVRPDETVLVVGCDFGKAPVVEVARLADGDAAASAAITGWVRAAVLRGGDSSLAFVVPAQWKPGLFAYRIVGPGGAGAEQILNAPDPWWWQGDGGATASPGGWLRVFGKSLLWGPASRAQLRSVAGRSLALTAAAADGYSLRFTLPADLAPGEYELWLHNGCGGQRGWRSAGNVLVRACRTWKQDVFVVKNSGSRPGEALLAALKRAEANGGGVVYLPRGRYPVQGTLTIPNNTVLRGEAMELVSLYWPDFDQPPPELLHGADFGLESLSLYCQNHNNVIADTAASTRMWLHRVRVRADCYFMIEEAGREFRKRRGPASHKECGAAVLLRGTNFELTDCDIYASNFGLRILKAKTGVIARNQIRYGGRGYSIENTDRLIFEDNLIAGNNLLSIGNDITTFWTNYCRNIYYARNRVEQMFGADREMMTLDAGGGAYYGHVAAAEGTRLTLAADPAFRDYAPRPHADWSGAALTILDGRGAGQYRLVTKNAGRQWEVDRPWIVAPDGSSRISIAPFRGRNLFIGNTFADGGAFQLYGAAHDSIVAGNQGARMDGFSVWGLNPHGWGQQPSWFCQFLDNQITEGNGYGGRSASFATIGSDDPTVYDGPMLRGIVFRRDQCRNNAAFRLGGTLCDALVEHCTICDSDVGVDVGAAARGVVLRGNVLKNVTHPFQGAGLPKALQVESGRE